MNRNERKRTIVYRVIIAILTMSIVVVGVYAWFSINKQAASKGMQMKVQKQETMHFTGTVIGESHRLDHSVTRNTYTVSGDHTLQLAASELNGESVSINGAESDLSFLFTDLLPGEYVDITVGFYMDDSYDGVGYEIAIADFNVDFDLNLDEQTSNKRFDLYSALDNKQYKHSLLGVFKWKPVKVVIDGAEEDLSSTEYVPLGTYSIGQDDVIPERIPLYTGVWDAEKGNAENPIYFTFRLEVDFQPYYTLISKSSDTDIKNLLSEKQLSIGSIVLLGN